MARLRFWAPAQQSISPASIRSADGDSLLLLSTHLRTDILDLTATHSLTQIFYNPATDESSSQSEYAYTFPLYDASAVTSFTAHITHNDNTRTLTAVIKPRQEARATYEKAKAENKTAVLLESNTVDVFTTSLGNVPAGAVVRIEVGYLHDLKQDLDTDGVRLVVSTVITPRYGEIPDGISAAEVLNQYTFGRIKGGKGEGGHAMQEGIALDINITMSGSIQEIQSSSHPLKVTLGSHNTAAVSQNSSFDSKKANAKLGTTSKSLSWLEQDFILTVRAESLDKPRAFLTPHPTNTALSTLLVTLVPKFVLPQQHPEIVLIVDRSGSMKGKIATVQAAAHLFLASLPVGVHFNICSFGSKHDFLFPTSSQVYTLAQAKSYVDGFDANYGGTEMLAPLKDTIERRLKDLPLETLFLTDGDVWNGDSLFELLQDAGKQNVRLFSLGIGDSISHSLIEGIARAGRGYAQTVTLEERLERKVLRMLKAALTPQVTDWSVEWPGKRAADAAFSSTLQQAKSEAEAETLPDVPSMAEPMSLYDEAVDPDSTPIIDLRSSELEKLPVIPSPVIVQAPRDIPPLFPYSRTTVYFLIPRDSSPKEVMLSGSFHDKTSNSITPLELAIPVIPLEEAGSLSTLFARKHLQDLSEGRPPHHFSTFISPSEQPTKFKFLVEREGTKVGMEYSLASQWTSFVAVDESGQVPPAAVDVEVRPDRATGGRGRGRGGAMRHRMIAAPRKSTGGKAARRQLASTATPPESTPYSAGDEKRTLSSSSYSTTADQEPLQSEGVFYCRRKAPKRRKARGSYPEPPEPPEFPEPQHSPSPEDILSVISKEQSFDGRFQLTEKLLAVLGVARDKLTVSGEEWILATMLVLKFLENDERMVQLKEESELVRMKAEMAVKGVETEEVRTAVEKVLGLE